MSDAPVKAKPEVAAPVEAAKKAVEVNATTIDVKDLIAHIAAEALKEAKKSSEPAKPKKTPPKLCPTCGQRADECLGEHVTIDMTVDEHPFRQWYRGHTVNGKTYYGKSAVVPKCMAADLLASKNNWVIAQREMLLGKDVNKNVGSA